MLEVTKQAVAQGKALLSSMRKQFCIWARLSLLLCAFRHDFVVIDLRKISNSDLLRLCNLLFSRNGMEITSVAEARMLIYVWLNQLETSIEVSEHT